MAQYNVLSLPRSSIWIPLLFNLFGLSVICTLIFFAFQGNGTILAEPYLLKIIFFTFFQAAVASALIIACAIVLTPSLHKLSGRTLNTWILHLISIPFFIPSLIGCLSLVLVFGQNGFLFHIFSFLNISYHTFLYGIIGIVLTHLFYYIPFALKQFSHTLTRCPGEYERLADSLISSSFFRFRYLYFPLLKKEIYPTFILVFIYCFRSFTTVLIFGGTPSNTTLEVALFQALNFDLNWVWAAQISLLQLTFSASFFFFTNNQKQKSSSKPEEKVSYRSLQFCTWIDKTMIFLCICFFALPLATLCWKSMTTKSFFMTLLHMEFWEALGNTLMIGFLTTIMSLFLVACFVYAKYVSQKHPLESLISDIPANMPLMFSPLVFATGFYILLVSHLENRFLLLLLLSAVNALSFLPNLYRVICPSFLSSRQRCDALCFSLSMSGWHRFKLIDWRAIKSALGYSISICFIFSLGEAKGILFFNQNHFPTLISLIYQKMHRYQFDQAASMSAWLIFICLFLFLAFQKIFGKRIR